MSLPSMIQERVSGRTRRREEEEGKEEEEGDGRGRPLEEVDVVVVTTAERLVIPTDPIKRMKVPSQPGDRGCSLP